MSISQPQTGMPATAELNALRDELQATKKRLGDFITSSGTGLPENSESMLLHEVGMLRRKPPYCKTNRRNVLTSVEFIDEVEYDEAVPMPLAAIPDSFRQVTRSYAFNSLSMTVPEMLTHMFVMFQELDLFGQLGIKPATLREFFRCTHNGYRQNQYHNFMHAMDVAQFQYAIFMDAPSLQARFNPIDILSFLLLGLGHDMDHPGVNNGFLIKTHDPIAILYNERSVLENAHCASLFFMLLNKPSANPMSTIDDALEAHASKNIRRGILATDMALHFDIVKQFNAVDPICDVEPEKVTDDMRFTLVECLAKCGDICHVVRPWLIAKEWEDRVQEEFFEQGDQEKELGFTPMGMFDREVCNVAGSQLWFYENMGKPLFEALARHVPETAHLLDTMMGENFVKWKEILEETKAAKEAAEAAKE
eukprot:m.34896 g.34896  ORF g.34896 m.34896 type:complete len:421 (+) comp9828_c0_seq2:709-1971(+)